MQTWTRVQRSAFFLIVFLGLVLRAHTLTTQPINMDEWYCMKMVTQPTLFQNLMMPLVTDLYPPFFYFCTWLSAHFGEGLFQLRFFSFAGGVASVALVFVIARRWGGTRAAIYAGLLAALSPMGVYYSQEFKLYSFFSAITLWVLYEALCVLEDPQPRWKRLALATGVAMYTSYLAPYLLAPIFLTAVWAWRQGWRDQARVAFKGLGVGILVYLPILPFFLKTMMMFGANFWELGRQQLLWYTAQNFSTGFVAPAPVAEGAALLFIAAVALNLRRRGPKAWAVAAIVAFAVLPSLMQFIQLQISRPAYSDRALLGAAYGWALAAGLGLATLDTWLASALLIAALGINGYSLNLHYDPATRSRYDFLVPYEALKKVWKPGDAVIHSEQQTLFPWSYYERQDHSGMPNYEKIEDPGFNYNAAMQTGRRYWRLVNAWLKERGLGLESGLDPHRVYGERFETVALDGATRLWYITMTQKKQDLLWYPMLNMWRNYVTPEEHFDIKQVAWIYEHGFHLVSQQQLSPGVDAYFFERKPPQGKKP
jgi:hypothetical protein